MTVAAFSGSYCDLRFIKTRKVCQVVIELPIERGAEFVAAFGAPNPAAECPVAIARLDPKATTKASAPDRERRKFSELPYPQQAGIRASDPDFRAYLGVETEDDAAGTIRMACGVQSRSELANNRGAADRWRELNARFENYQAASRYEGMIR